MIIITSKQDGFRRCGVAHPGVATDYPNDRFSDEELETLQKEPMLTVVVGDDKPAEEKPGKSKKE